MLTSQQLESLAILARAAVQSARSLGMPRQFADVSLAQAILESGWGGTMSGENNIFGIKFDHFNSLGFTDVLTHETLNGVSTRLLLPFQNYADETEAFRDHARIFLNGPLAPKYRAWASANGSPADLIQAISFPGNRPLYATSQSYSDSLNALLRMPPVIQALSDAKGATQSA